MKRLSVRFLLLTILLSISLAVLAGQNTRLSGPGSTGFTPPLGSTKGSLQSPAPQALSPRDPSSSAVGVISKSRGGAKSKGNTTKGR